MQREGPYTLVVHGTGPHGDSGEISANLAMRDLVARLNRDGHTGVVASLTVGAREVCVDRTPQQEPDSQHCTGCGRRDAQYGCFRSLCPAQRHLERRRELVA